ncbi:unnamed protein product [Meganyctiphanes norvegica]|uniref:RING-type domain-containing protein n=1 Tax=Meganyctiphanes norvegica TaxID=48144 RepID=A0AAV2QKE8_MEGNR
MDGQGHGGISRSMNGSREEEETGVPGHQDTLPFIFTDPKMGYRSCPVCFEKYEETLRQPVMLPVCGHTVCRSCLSSLSNDEYLSCPCCRTGHVGFSLDQLPTNYIALNGTEPSSTRTTPPGINSISGGLNETPLSPTAPPLLPSRQHEPLRLSHLTNSQNPKCKIAILVIFTIIILLCFAMIIIGSIKIYDCPAEGYIPIWLIVSGLLLIVLVAQSAKCINDKGELSIIFGYLLSLHVLFHIAWFIAGCVWVYGIHPANHSLKQDRKYCDFTLYQFSFWLLNIAYIFIFIFMLCGFGYLMLSTNKHYVIFKVICPNLNKIRDPKHRIIFLVILTLIIVLCFAMIIIGGINMHSCPVEPYVPVWLIIAGMCLLVLAVQGAKYITEEETPVFLGCLFGINLVFHATWFVSGCVWVYGIYEPNYYILQTTEFGNVKTVNYCDYTVYMFSLWLLNLGFIGIGIIVCFSIFYCLSNWC